MEVAELVDSIKIGISICFISQQHINYLSQSSVFEVVRLGAVEDIF